MTDYLYGLSLATQTKGFLLSMGLGFVMGFFYDLFRIIRLAISKKKVFIIIFDLLYCIFLCFVSFVFCMTVNEGQFRLYLLLGEAIGFAVYYFSLGVVVFTFGEKSVEVIKSCFKRIFKIITTFSTKLENFVENNFQSSKNPSKRKENNLKNSFKTTLDNLYGFFTKGKNNHSQ